MIEIEKNFDLRPGDKERLIEGARFLAKKTIKDVYYDTADFRLTKKDFWLRNRNGRWELKAPITEMAEMAKRDTDQYHELESEPEIISKLELPGREPLEAELKKIFGAEPFATIVTERESYKKDDFHLDFDVMSFGFTTFEIELMIADEKDASVAEKRIQEFALRHKIATTKGAGKVIEYIRRNNPVHYDVLAKAGVIRHDI